MKRTDTKRDNPLHGRRKKKAFRKKNFWCSIYKRNEHVFSFIEEAIIFIAHKYFKMKGGSQFKKKIFWCELPYVGEAKMSRLNYLKYKLPFPY